MELKQQITFCTVDFYKKVPPIATLRGKLFLFQ